MQFNIPCSAMCLCDVSLLHELEVQGEAGPRCYGANIPLEAMIVLNTLNLPLAIKTKCLSLPSEYSPNRNDYITVFLASNQFPQKITASS
eukprot:3129071-Amphidinium_carterae.1